MTTPTILSENLDVRIKPFDREEYVANLTLKISSFSTPARPGGLLIELTSEADLFLYFSLRLSDSDFHALKLDQRLLVEFAQLPTMIKQLLPCKQMSTALSIDLAGDATFSLIEANQFRELVHLTLRLKAGTDESIKGYLASRLGQFKSVTCTLESHCAELVDELKRVSREKITAETDAQKARQDADVLAAKCQSALAQLREDHAREIRSLHMSSSSEHSLETRRLAEQVHLLEDRNRSSEQKLDEARISLISSESQLNQYTRKISSLETEIENFKRLQSDFADNGSKQQQCSDSKIAQLETTLTEKESQVKKLQGKLKEAKLTIKEMQTALLTQEQVVVRETVKVDDLQNQLKESLKSTETNAQLIAYLNKKVNDQRITIPEYPNRSNNFANTLSSVKFTPRSNHSSALIK